MIYEGMDEFLKTLGFDKYQSMWLCEEGHPKGNTLDLVVSILNEFIERNRKKKDENDEMYDNDENESKDELEKIQKAAQGSHNALTLLAQILLLFCNLNR